MKKLSSIFVAFAVFCFIVLASCQGSGKTEAPAETTEEVVEEAVEEVVDSAAAVVEEAAETPAE